MNFYEDTYYHLYNRTNNKEVLFRSEENYIFFLKKYRFYLDDYIETIGYCLMPTHFHFLIKVRTNRPDNDLNVINKKVGTLLNSYAQAYNKMWERKGNLFNQKTKAKIVSSNDYLINLLTYIHQNPIRSKFVEKAEEWKYSSYLDYIDIRNGTLPNKELILSMIKKEEIKELKEQRIINSTEIDNI